MVPYDDYYRCNCEGGIFVCPSCYEKGNTSCPKCGKKDLAFHSGEAAENFQRDYGIMF
jgi:hypothetical protein